MSIREEMLRNDLRQLYSLLLVPGSAVPDPLVPPDQHLTTREYIQCIRLRVLVLLHNVESMKRESEQDQRLIASLISRLKALQKENSFLRKRLENRGNANMQHPPEDLP